MVTTSDFRRPGVLDKTKCYLIGSMQYENGEEWREVAQAVLGDMGVTTFNPYKRPFIDGPPENSESHKVWRQMLQEGRYDEVAEIFKEVRSLDLSMVDRADFIICYLKPSVFTAGTMEELSWAVRLKRPIFLVMDGGKQETPFWILGMLPHKYIYSSFAEVFKVLEDINSGNKEIDSKRWRLLRPELR